MRPSRPCVTTPTPGRWRRGCGVCGAREGFNRARVVRAAGRGYSRAMSEAQIIDGKILSERLRAEAAEEVARLRSGHGLQPGLAVVLVGEDPASQIYVRSKGEH